MCLRYRGERYEHYQAVRDGSAWICSAVRQCIGPTARHPNQPAAAPITITATTKRHPDCSAIRPAPASTTAIISIHNLHSELRYAGHELPECVCPRRTWRRQSVLQSDLQQPTTGVQAILRFGAVVSAPGASASRPVLNPPQSHPQTPQAPNPARPDRDREADNSPQPIPGLSRPFSAPAARPISAHPQDRAPPHPAESIVRSTTSHREPACGFSSWRPDCVAEVVGLELRNVVANYPFEKSRRFPGSSRILATETIPA